MKTRILKSILALLLTFMALPMMGQDFMNIYFKNGDFRKFYMKNITEITTKKVDADGVQHSDYDYQYITTIYDKYVYNLEDVDSITFTKIDEEKAEQNFVSAMPVVFSVIDDCETIGDVESRIDEIKNAEGVADAWSDGHQLYVSIAEDEIYSFHFSHDIKMDTTSIEDFSAQLRALKPQMESVVKQKGKQLKAVIANQRHFDEQMSIIINKYSNILIKYFTECGVHVDYLEDPTVDFFYDNSDDPEHLHLYDYDIILLITHGGYGPIMTYYKIGYLGLGWSMELNLKAHFFETSEVITKKERINTADWWADNYKKFESWRDKTPYYDLTDVDVNYTFQNEVREGKSVWVAHPTLTEYFFRDIAKGKFKNPNSILFSSACESLKGDNNKPSYSFANILLNNRNLGIYGGYTESNFFGPVAGPVFYSLLLSGVSVDKSIRDYLYDWLKKESLQNIIKDEETFIQFINEDSYKTFKNKELELSNAELKIFDKSGSMPNGFFLFPTTTVEADNNSINQEYASKQTVTIEGYITYLEASNLETGFEFGDNSELGTEYGIHESVKKEFVNNEYGKYRIELTISNLTPCQTYYYRAYTFDGNSCNYGDTYSFYIYKNLQISSLSLTLNEGETGQIDIISVNGSYEIDNSNDNVTKVTLDSEKLIIEAISAGMATVTVLDRKSGQQIDIPVIVVDSSTDVPAEAIDLGLPSGTLWASYNIGATKPEEYGDYFSWGETEAKDNYDWSTYIYCDGTKETCYNIGGDISGTEYDVAHVKWGGNWEMPSYDQFAELEDHCKYEWTTLNGVSGMRFTGSNGNSIFFPATGDRTGTDTHDAGFLGAYWSSTREGSSSGLGITLYWYYSDYVQLLEGARYVGLSVRPVINGN